MDAIRNWAYSISAVVIFGTLVELIMPGNTYRKYIHLTLGLLLILTLLRPFISLIGGGADFNSYIDYYVDMSFSDSMLSEPAEIQEKQKEDVIKIYKQTLENNIKTRLETKLNLSGRIESAEVSIIDNGSEYGMIGSVTVNIMGGDIPISEIQDTISAVTGITDESIVIKRLE